MEKTAIEKLIQTYRYSSLKNLMDKTDDFWDTISGIKITALGDKTPSIKIIYVHYTEHYTLNDYCLNEDSETEEAENMMVKETRIEFGYSEGRFYISGKTPIRVYSKRDSPQIPYAYSSTYEHELDDCNQALLLDKYLDNKNVPEWLAIGFFKALRLGYANIDKMVADLNFK